MAQLIGFLVAMYICIYLPWKANQKEESRKRQDMYNNLNKKSVDEKGNVHYVDRLCNEYINGEQVKKVETTDRNGVKLYSTVGVNSSKVI